MNQGDLRRTVDALANWKPPDGVTPTILIRGTPPDRIEVGVKLEVDDCSIKAPFSRPPAEDDLQRLAVLAGGLLDWAAGETATIAGHGWD